MRKLSGARFEQGLLSIMFGIIIVLPLIGMWFSQADELSAREKRRLSPAPAFERSWSSLADFPGQFDAWFDDHFGWRNDIIFAANAFKRKLFNVSNAKGVFLGQDNWLFFNLDGSMRDRVGDRQLNQATLETTHRALITKSRWLAQLGIHYLLVPVPNKSSIYPEKLPARVRSVLGTRGMRQFIEFVEAKGGSDHLLDIEAVLNQGKNDQLLYLKTDTHWNEYGTYLGYREIVARLQNRFPGLEPVIPDEIRKTPEAHRGDIAIAAAFTADEPEQTERFSLKQPCFNREYLELDQFKLTPAYAANPGWIPQQATCAKRDLTAIVIMDSFGASTRKYFNQNFARVIYMRSYHLFGMRDFLREVQPDVLIDVRVERNLFFTLREDPRLQSELDSVD